MSAVPPRHTPASSQCPSILSLRVVIAAYSISSRTPTATNREGYVKKAEASKRGTSREIGGVFMGAAINLL
jgi:hypothetical protein